jgi:hypothetical protein
VQHCLVFLLHLNLFLQGCAVDEVVATIIKSGGPQDNGTKADACHFHDDKVRASA